MPAGGEHPGAVAALGVAAGEELAQAFAGGSAADAEEEGFGRGQVGAAVVEGVVVEVLEDGLGGEAAAVTALAQEGPDEAAAGGEAKGEGDEEEGDDDDEGPGGDVGVDGADDSAGAAGEGAEDGGEDDHLAELVGPLAGGDAGGDEHADHEDDAGELEAEHDGDDDEGGERHAEEVDAEAAGAGEFGIEGDEFELFPEEGEDDE